IPTRSNMYVTGSRHITRDVAPCHDSHVAGSSRDGLRNVSASPDTADGLVGMDHAIQLSVCRDLPDTATGCDRGGDLAARCAFQPIEHGRRHADVAILSTEEACLDFLCIKSRGLRQVGSAIV